MRARQVAHVLPDVILLRGSFDVVWPGSPRAAALCPCLRCSAHLTHPAACRGWDFSAPLLPAQDMILESWSTLDSNNIDLGRSPFMTAPVPTNNQKNGQK